jgi:hypothetical protein
LAAAAETAISQKLYVFNGSRHVDGKSGSALSPRPLDHLKRYPDRSQECSGAQADRPRSIKKKRDVLFYIYWFLPKQLAKAKEA